MKNNKILSILFLIFAFALSYASAYLPNDKEYFKDFRKNESPTGKNFVKIGNVNSRSTIVLPVDYYTIYSEDEKGNGYYLQIEVLKGTAKPTATYIAYEKSEITENAKRKIISLTTTLCELELMPYTIDPTNELEASIEEDPDVCARNCNRREKCYYKLTDIGVLLCAARCSVECSSID